MLKKSCGWPVLFYAVLLIVLGFVGYQAGSSASLYAGGGLGFLVLISSIGMLKGKDWASYTALLLTLILTVVFAFRYTATGKTIPAALSVVSGFMLMFLLGSFAKEQQPK